MSISCTSNKNTYPKEISVDQKSNIEPVNQASLPMGTGMKAIVHPRIITGDGTTIIEDGCVIISGSIIHWVGKFSQVSIPESAEIFDATGMTLLPGLIDAHFHLDNMDSLPGLFLSRGITSLRDPGAWIEAYDGERALGTPLPRLFLTGPHIDMSPPAYPDNSFVVRDQLEAQSAVNEFADQGASAIKIYFRSSLGIIQAVCEAAKQRQIPVTAHLEITDIYEAVEAGLSGIEHITSLGTSLVSNQEAEAYKQAILKDNNARRLERYTMWKNIDPRGKAGEELGKFLAENNTYICPTLGAFEYQATEGTSDQIRQSGFQHMMAYTKKLHDMEVNIVVGSHSWVKYSAYGWAYHHELELLEQLGMSPLQIIKSATSLNAAFFGVSEKLGTIEQGKLADLILLNANPLEGISGLRQIKRVMLSGVWID